MLSYLLDYDINITLFTLGFNEERGNIETSKVIIFFTTNEVSPVGFQKEMSYYSLYFRTYFVFESNYTPAFPHFSTHDLFLG